MANRLDACEQIVRRLGIGVVQQAFVARALCTRLIGIDTRDDKEFVLDLLGKIAQTYGVLQHRVLAIGRARADDKHLASIFARKNARDFGIERLFLLHQLGAERHLLADLHRNGEPALEIHGHGMHLLLSYCGAAALAPKRSNVLDYPLLRAKVQRFLSAKTSSAPVGCAQRHHHGKSLAFAEVSSVNAES